MKNSLIIPVFFCIIYLTHSSWALDRFTRTAFNFDNFNYEFKADPDCEIEHLQSTQMSFTYSAKNGAVHVFVNGKESINYSPIEKLNGEKSQFTSCWSDGVVGYEKSDFYNDRIIKKLVIESSGFLCQGGTTLFSEEVIYTFHKNKLIVRLISANYIDDNVYDYSCSLTRIQF